MNVLVTGASGFVASHLATNLARSGHNLICVAKDAGQFEVNGKPHEIHGVELTDRNRICSFLRGKSIDCTVHLGGISHQLVAERDRDIVQVIKALLFPDTL